MRRSIWIVPSEKAIVNLGVDEWPTMSDDERAELLTSYLLAVLPGYVRRRFGCRVTPTAITTAEGDALFVLETGWCDEFT